MLELKSLVGKFLPNIAATSACLGGDYYAKYVSWIGKSSRKVVSVLVQFCYLILRCFSPLLAVLLHNTSIQKKMTILNPHGSLHSCDCTSFSSSRDLNVGSMKERCRICHFQNENEQFVEYETTDKLQDHDSSTTLLLDEVCERRKPCYVAEELDVSFLELSDGEEDSDLEVENMEYEMSFSIESPNETEESYRQRGKHRQNSIVIEVSDAEATTLKGTTRAYQSMTCFDYTSPIDIDFKSSQQIYQHVIFPGNSLEERQRKVFCDSESNQWDSQDSSFYSDSLISAGGLHSLKSLGDLDCKEDLRVSEKVICWEENVYADMSEHDVNCIVENVTENFHSSQEEKCKPSPEKMKGNVDFEDNFQHDVKNEFHPFLCTMLCAFFLNLYVLSAVFTQSEENVLKFQAEKKKKKKRKILHTSKRKKRQRQRLLREIINWQISLRRNTTVMYDFQTQNIYPSRRNGNTRLDEIANEGLEGGQPENGIVQSRPAEAIPSIEEQQNGLPNGNSATFPRYVSERNQTGNMDTIRQFFSNPTMEIERPQVDPLTRSLPAIHTVGPHMGGISTSEALPRIEESEACNTLSTENNAVPPTEERQSQGMTATEEAVSTPSQPSAPQEADGQSMTSTSTPSHSSVPPEADGQSMPSTETLSSFFSSVSLSSVEEDEAFRYEWIRLKTFSNWPLTSLFSTAMARGGWVALGEGDKARCYSCHVVHQGWRIGDNPLDFHDRHCRFLQSVSDNVPIIREEPAPTPRTVERDRERPPGHGEVAPQGNMTGQVPRPEEERNVVMNLMSKDVGEPFQEERGNLVVESSNPGNVTTNLQMSERPPVYNSLYTSRPTPQLVTPMESNPILKHSPSNPQGHSAAGPPPLPPGREAQLEALRRDPMGINFDRPKYPSYAILAVRISSFTDWPTAMTQTPRDMALAGFFYAGYGDYTRCFFCGGGLRNWEAGDDPWVEHARWFSKCAFVRQNRGQQFIDLVLRRAAEMEEQRSQDEAGNSQTNAQTNTQTSEAAQTLAKEEKIMKSAAVISIKDMGYSEEIIKTAITTIKSRLPRGKHKVSAQEILEVIFELADSQRASENSSSQSEPQRNVDQSESSSTSAVQSGATTENVTNNVSQSNSTTDKTDQSTSEEAAATGTSNAGELGENLLSNPTFDELTSLRQENTSLKDQIVCKICMEKNVSIAFLPCGHLACCADCAPAMRKCPICREFVRGTVKTYLV
ncbi:uncharacterized protein LOC134269469 [Saccostrea cucullata]|uniref:uncharacterized protein LOC134269469 n=1 Tax=Saccostrea cuccullata TaxID=36930 RepID=UPI002ED112E0